MDSNILSNPLQSTSELYFCNICNKPFKKEHSRNRHISYCSRTHNGPRIRTRPCRECSVAKAKCSSQPRCSRCTRKGIECVFENYNSLQISERSVVTAITINQSPQPLMAEWEGFSNDVGIRVDGVVPNEPQALPEFDLGISNTLVLHNQSPGLRSFAAQHNPSGTLTYSSRQQSIAPSGTGHRYNQTAMVWSPWRTPDDQFPALSIPTHIPAFPACGTIALRPMSNPVAQNNANYIIRTLRTFPQRMLRRATFPPFIHQPWPTDSNGFIIDAPEPMANCMSIAQIFASRTPENTAFVWRTIRAEQQRLVDEMDHFSKAEFLAAIQASIIYLIMRVADDSGKHIELDSQMLLSTEMQMIYKRFTRFCNGQNLQFEHSSHITSWEDWIFAESRRRIACLWFLTGRVASIKARMECDTPEGFLILPLPSSKLLWEASTSPLWECEYELDALEKTSRVSTIDELIEAHQRPSDFSNTRLDTWNAGIDDLGFLLNLATAMV